MPTHGLAATHPVLAACLIVATGCASAPVAPPMAAGRPAGYLVDQPLPDGVALLPAPPEAGAALALDEEVMRASLGIRDARWEQAMVDADLAFPGAPRAFSCALGAPITPRDTPQLYQLLQRSSSDASDGMRATEQRYGRSRPFMRNGRPTCTPDDEPGLRQNGSCAREAAALRGTPLFPVRSAGPSTPSSASGRTTGTVVLR